VHRGVAAPASLCSVATLRQTQGGAQDALPRLRRAKDENERVERDLENRRGKGRVADA